VAENKEVPDSNIGVRELSHPALFQFVSTACMGFGG
jgi:hypothetical protein